MKRPLLPHRIIQQIPQRIKHHTLIHRHVHILRQISCHLRILRRQPLRNTLTMKRPFPPPAQIPGSAILAISSTSHQPFFPTGIGSIAYPTFPRIPTNAITGASSPRNSIDRSICVICLSSRSKGHCGCNDITEMKLPPCSRETLCVSLMKRNASATESPSPSLDETPHRSSPQGLSQTEPNCAIVGHPPRCPPHPVLTCVTRHRNAP